MTDTPGADASPEEWATFRDRLRAEAEQRLAVNRLAHYKPYPKQKEFHAASANKRERLFMAGNQLGKTYAGAAEVAMHLTGRYPDWWEGRRWDRPVRVICGSENALLTRNGQQKLLVGPPEVESAWGTGYIPKDCLADTARKMGTPDALDSVSVKYRSGGSSVCLFKSYEQGRKSWQADTVDLVWFDEEPPEDVYSEGLTRTNATDGIVMLTFTPLMGMSNVVRRFRGESSPDRQTIVMTINDAEHYTPEKRAQIIASYPAHEREARANGVPMLGSGRIFPIDEATITVPPFQIPPHWPVIGGLDFGWDHPTAAVKLAWDRDNDIVYMVREHRQSEATPATHAAVIGPRKWGAIPWAWPHDGEVHDKGSGIGLARQYKDNGLLMLGEHATFPNGSNSVEAGIMDMLDRMMEGRWKLFAGACPLWLEEFREYHRKDGKIVKEHDDLISASRYAMMMLRHARIERARRDPFGFNDERGGPGARALGTGEVSW